MSKFTDFWNVLGTICSLYAVLELGRLIVVAWSKHGLVEPFPFELLMMGIGGAWILMNFFQSELVQRLLHDKNE